MKRLKLFVPFVVFVILAAMLYRGLGKDPNDLPSVLIGRTVPAFELPDLDKPSEILTVDSMKGKAYLLNVWATWCPSCKHEHPYLIKLAESGIPIYGINYKDDGEAARELLQRTGNPYVKNIFDEEGSLVMSLGVYGAPETFVVDDAGVIRYRHVGVVNEKVWTSEFSKYFYGE